MLKKISGRIRFAYLSRIRPERVAVVDSKGNRIKGTGTSNMTHISNQGDNLKLGEDVFIGHFNYIDAFNDEVVIGRGVQITNYISILTHSSHNDIRYPNLPNHEDLRNNGKIFIGDYTFIGPHTVIMPNSSIGKACIVSSYSYVKGDFPDYSIIAGNPARIVGDTRNTDKKLIENYPEIGTYRFEPLDAFIQ